MNLYIKSLSSLQEGQAKALVARDALPHPFSSLPLPAIGLFVGKHELVGFLCYAQDCLEGIFQGDVRAYYSFLEEANVGTRPLYRLSFLFVDPSIRKKGIGSMLLKDLEKRLGESDFLAEIPTSSDDVASFLTNRGFIRVPDLFRLHREERKILFYKPYVRAGLCSRGNW